MKHAESNNFLIKYPETPDEKKGLYSLNNNVHESTVSNLTEKLIGYHHDMGGKNFVIAKNLETGRVVATIAMIPWKIKYSCIELNALEMGIVATDENFRMKGLQKMLNDYFVRYMEDEGFELSIIQGIPGFYSNFGYHYAILLENQVFMELHSIESANDSDMENISIRMAADDDFPFITSQYADHISDYYISSIHVPEHYRFMAEKFRDSETDSDIFLVLENGIPAGYFKITLRGFTDGLMVSEASDMDYNMNCAVLRFLKKLAIERGKPFIKFVMPDFHDFIRFIYAMGGYHKWGYQWQIKFNIMRFFNRIKPLLEQRINASMFRGLTYRLPVYLYSTGIAIRFENGHIAGFEEYREQQEECSISIKSFYRLITGCRTLGQLMNSDNEIFMTGKNRLILETLFPAGNSYLYPHY